MKEEAGKGKRNKVLIGIGILLVIAIIAAVVITFYPNLISRQCSDFSCFESSMKSCSKASYVNEEPEASWGYVIKGIKGDNCAVEVTLLQAKKGSLGIDALNGLKMTCQYPKGIADYPEKDLTKCSGQLREELQTIIINKLHVYIINNLGQLNESLRGLTGLG